jgi:hypothetical protein
LKAEASEPRIFTNERKLRRSKKDSSRSHVAGQQLGGMYEDRVALERNKRSLGNILT